MLKQFTNLGMILTKKRSMPVPNVYNTDSDGNEYYSQENNVDVVVQNRYAVDKDKIPFYPRDSNRNEFMDPDLGLIERNGKYEYPRTVEGRPNYRVNPTDPGPVKKQLYELINTTYIIGTDLLGNMVYAKNSNGDEYYPADNTPAKKANGTIIYARKKNRDVVFPIDAKGDEFYLTFINPLEPDTIPNRYARVNNNRDEIYPQKVSRGDLISDYIINNTYAKRDGVNYYPRDAYNNEFYISPLFNTVNVAPAVILLNSYAVTNDGKIILPSIGNTYYIDPNKQPAVTNADIIGRLVREVNSVSPDYLTKIEVSVKPTVPPREYNYYDIKTNIIKSIRPPHAPAASSPSQPSTAIPFFKTWYFYFLVFLMVILKSFLIWWFFFRQTSIRVNWKN